MPKDINARVALVQKDGTEVDSTSPVPVVHWSAQAP